ncbi:MAG: ribonuclease P protein component [Planctomycetota bacterium]
MDQRFPKGLRLLRPNEFRTVFDRGRSRSDGRLVVYARPRDEGGATRLGLVVGRRFGPSHLRNTWKRRVREAFRTSREVLPEGHDLVVLPAANGAVPGFAETVESLVEAARGAAGAYARSGPRR